MWPDQGPQPQGWMLALPAAATGAGAVPEALGTPYHKSSEYWALGQRTWASMLAWPLGDPGGPFPP